MSHSYSERAGIRPGDIIIKVNEKSVNCAQDIYNLQSADVTYLDFDIIRQKTKHNIRVALTDDPKVALTDKPKVASALSSDSVFSDAFTKK